MPIKGTSCIGSLPPSLFSIKRRLCANQTCNMLHLVCWWVEWMEGSRDALKYSEECIWEGDPVSVGRCRATATLQTVREMSQRWRACRWHSAHLSPALCLCKPGSGIREAVSHNTSPTVQSVLASVVVWFMTDPVGAGWRDLSPTQACKSGLFSLRNIRWIRWGREI